MKTITERLSKAVQHPLFSVAVILFVFEAVLLPKGGHDFDRMCFLSWCTYIFENGIQSAYHVPYPEFNYPPLIAYPMFLFGKFQGSAEYIDRYFHFFKLFALLFDFIAALVIVRMVDGNKRAIPFFLLIVANPLFTYNSYYWGQVDSVLSALVLLSFVFAFKERLVMAVLFFMLAINFKVQAIIFLPPLALLMAYKFWGNVKWLTIIQAVIAVGVVQLLILAPFILAGEMPNVIKAFVGSVDFYPRVSMYANNIWCLFFPDNVFEMADTGIWYCLTYKQWGLIMFCIASFFAMLPLFRVVVKRAMLDKRIDLSAGSLFATFALIPLLFFYFNTQMHERYSHPAFIFIALFAFSQRKYFLLALICISYFGNVELNARLWGFPHYKILLFDKTFGSVLYLLLIVSLFYYLYKPYLGGNKKVKHV